MKLSFAYTGTFFKHMNPNDFLKNIEDGGKERFCISSSEIFTSEKKKVIDKLEYELGGQIIKEFIGWRLKINLTKKMMTKYKKKSKGTKNVW